VSAAARRVVIGLGLAALLSVGGAGLALAGARTGAGGGRPAQGAPTATPLAVQTPRFTQTVLQPITPTPAAGGEFDRTGEIRDHYYLGRPFPRDPSGELVDYPARNYAYGSQGGGGYPTHFGLDYQNGYGTAILAVGDGWVVYAGSDAEVQFGPRPDFYGNLVVIEHDRTAPDGRPLYSLYGHMSKIDVEMGQRIHEGEKIGQVGSTGVALGSHLHLEVRIGDAFDYGSTYNPDLWLRPWPTFGTLAGRIYDRDGRRMYGATIAILTARSGGPSRYTFSYADDALNPDPYYGEHFTYADLPAGEYQVVVRIAQVTRFKGTVRVEAGQTNWIEIRLN